MISTSWGAPAAFTKGFDLKDVSDGLYGKHLHVYNWPDGELKQILDLGDTGLLPLEVKPQILHSQLMLLSSFTRKQRLPLDLFRGFR